MNIIFTLTKEDINTREMGYHFEIIKDNFYFNFTPEAMDELVKCWLKVKVEREINSNQR